MAIAKNWTMIEVKEKLKSDKPYWDNHKIIEYTNGTQELKLSKEFKNGNTKTASWIVENGVLILKWNEEKKDYV